MNKPVSFELATLLKEKGFIERAEKRYGTKSGILYNDAVINDLEDDVFIAAPTIADVMMWIYEKHEIWIQVKPGGKLETWDFIVQKKDNTFAVSYFEIKQHKPFFNSPTEAYEAAIQYAINKLV